jgi:S1-C subfamily serine protease
MILLITDLLQRVAIMAYEEHPHPSSTWLQTFGPFILIVGAVLLGVYLFSGVRELPNGPVNDPKVVARNVAPRGQRDPDEIERIELFKRSKNSVVNVDTIQVMRDYDFSVVEQQSGTGSGFIWDKEGRIVTNFHVIQPALKRNSEIRVVLADRTPWKARIVGVSPDHDLAVLQINPSKDKLEPISIGTSSDLEVGQTVFAIGNPFGLSLTLTQGIISALDREIQSVTERPIKGVIQTDAAINPGNSGGPLLDKDGRLIGVNTAITSPTGGSVGIGYSIPIDTVNEVVPELIRQGRTAKPYLGLVTLPEQYSRKLGLEKGLIIQEVRPGSPAAKAGFRGLRFNPQTRERLLGDILVTANGQPMNRQKDLEKILNDAKVGDKIQLEVQRGDDVIQAEILLEGI